MKYNLTLKTLLSVAVFSSFGWNVFGTNNAGFNNDSIIFSVVGASVRVDGETKPKEEPREFEIKYPQKMHAIEIFGAYERTCFVILPDETRETLFFNLGTEDRLVKKADTYSIKDALHSVYKLGYNLTPHTGGTFEFGNDKTSPGGVKFKKSTNVKEKDILRLPNCPK